MSYSQSLAAVAAPRSSWQTRPHLRSARLERGRCRAPPSSSPALGRLPRAAQPRAPRALVRSPRSASTSVGRKQRLSISTWRRQSRPPAAKAEISLASPVAMISHQVASAAASAHPFDIVASKAPIALGFEVSQLEFFLNLLSGMIGCLVPFVINHDIAEQWNVVSV